MTIFLNYEVERKKKTTQNVKRGHKKLCQDENGRDYFF